MRAYRAFAVERPHRYQLIPQRARDDADLAAAADRVLSPILAALRGYCLPRERLIHAARCVRVAAHGFATLQAVGGFQLAEDVDESFEVLIKMVVDGVERLTK